MQAKNRNNFQFIYLIPYNYTACRIEKSFPDFGKLIA